MVKVSNLSPGSVWCNDAHFFCFSPVVQMNKSKRLNLSKILCLANIYMVLNRAVCWGNFSEKSTSTAWTRHSSPNLTRQMAGKQESGVHSFHVMPGSHKTAPLWVKAAVYCREVDNLSRHLWVLASLFFIFQWKMAAFLLDAPNDEQTSLDYTNTECYQREKAQKGGKRRLMLLDTLLSL